MSVLPARIHTYAPYICLVVEEIRRPRWVQDPLIWSYRCLSTTMWVLGTESEPSARAVSAPNHRAIAIPFLFFPLPTQ